MPAFNDLIGTLVEKVKLCCGVLFNLVKKLHTLRVLDLLLFANLLRLLMVVVPFVVELVLQNFIFRILSLFFLRFKLLIVFFEVLINITSVVPPSAR